MIIIVRKDTGEAQLSELLGWIEQQGLHSQTARGELATVVSVIGDSSSLDVDRIRCLPFVQSVKRITEPFLLAGRGKHPQDTVVSVSGVLVGGGHFALIAGPCAVESEEQLLAAARCVKASGASILRGGAFKPRTSPYDFQGLGIEGLRILSAVKKETGLPVVSEIVDPSTLPFYEDVDLIQVGARNGQNYELLKELARCGKPILLKRSPASTLREYLMAAEYLLAGGNGNVILCERGVRGFDTETRAVLDVSALPVLHELSHLPVIADPSHAAGQARYVGPLSLAAVAAGADGLMVEVHCDPPSALCDAAQALTPESFDRLSARVRRLREALHD
ncbi:MAG: 3-deoxy-7-phosphoheptulonate synthase [Oscillospiraceae bacterium]|nr:3-deoxy-7-phosphoheptulonate synthase [Oscillospiraceae bacterium]